MPKAKRGDSDRQKHVGVHDARSEWPYVVLFASGVELSDTIRSFVSYQ